MDAISYHVDYLYKSKPQKLPIVKLILPLYSWASPPYVQFMTKRNLLPTLEDSDVRNRWLYQSSRTFITVQEAIKFLENLKS